LGVYIIKESLKVPKTVLEDIWTETLKELRDNPKFNLETVEKIEAMVNEGIIITDEIIDLLNG